MSVPNTFVTKHNTKRVQEFFGDLSCLDYKKVFWIAGCMYKWPKKVDSYHESDKYEQAK